VCRRRVVRRKPNWRLCLPLPFDRELYGSGNRFQGYERSIPKVRRNSSKIPRKGKLRESSLPIPLLKVCSRRSYGWAARV
jgi:hypothetical protein